MTSGDWPTGAMRALALEGPGRVVQTSLPIPAPEPGTVLVRPAHVGLCGTDLELLHGTAAYLNDGRSGYPHVFGHEWWGRVVTADGGFAPGEAVVGHTMISCGLCPNCQRGRRAVCRNLIETGLYGQQGAAAEFIRLPAHALTRLPAGTREPWAVLVEPAVTVVESLERTGCGPFDRVAVLGTGTIGLLTVQLARHRGAEVEAIGIDPAGLELATKFGATAAYRPEDAPERAYSLVVEASGASAAFLRSLDLVETGGRVAVVGVAGEPVGGLVPGNFVLGGFDVYGIRHGLDHYERTVGLFASRVLDGAALVAEIVPAADAEQAFKLLEHGRSGRPKVILEMGGA
ncbi:zinc-dependent alcohol dehydrogenase [Amycolatopsis anabasis]|uniref:zinc-dependent alcohol dehydrogenase n=1 Tax=Amycolatopsis anabasis TaxID=1840409 RepID=UPI001C5538C1|nr:alcohol dehydrogenase catalytic domain-containing protein [Amycolatopsis anabasis]